MRQALDHQDVDGISAMAHKMLPLFTMIEASEAVPLLSRLEASRREAFSENMRETTLAALKEIHRIICSLSSTSSTF